MKFVRTANAGVWLELDGINILLDGISNKVYPYLETPDEIKELLKKTLPDVVGFTHTHSDHYDEDYVKFYKEMTHRPVVGPVGVNQISIGDLKLESVSSRQIGKVVISHVCFVLSGTKNVWFMGDASPDALKLMEDYPNPDVLFVPYAFALTNSAWRKTKETGAEKIVLLHLPNPQDDADGLWNMVLENVGQDDCLCIPEMGKTFEIV